MKIVLDLTIIVRKDKITGIERVALESVRHLLKESHDKHSYYIICSKTGEEFLKEELKNQSHDFEKMYASPFSNRILTDQLWIPLIINKIKPDFVYYTTLGIPLINHFPFFFIIHDAVAWAMPSTISRGMKFYYKPLIERATKNKKLNKVMTVSNFSKTEIEHYLNISSSKIFVNYLGVSSSFLNFKSDSQRAESIKTKYNTGNHYIISLGTLEPRKNLDGLLKGFERLKSEYRYKGKLVLVGRKGWSENLNITEKDNSNVILTGFVEDDELPFLMKLSDAFVFPSLYEGFGLPLIEAMSLGVPVIASNRASLTEIGGDACKYFDPIDQFSIAESIAEVIDDKKTRQYFSQQARNRSKLFTWQRHARILNEFLRVILHEN